MIFERFVVGMLQTNCYLLGDEEARVAVIVDPGGDTPRLSARIGELGFELAAILLTHGHFDHAMDAWTLRARHGGLIYLHEKDYPLLRDRMVGMGAVLGADTDKITIDKTFSDGETVKFGSIELKAIETPGHTPGHVSLLLEKEKILLVGDVLFAGSIGRTDFPGGSYDQLIASVTDKIFPLDGNTVVYPGHGPETTVDKEKRTNPFFR